MSEENNETVDKKPNVAFVGKRQTINKETGVEELVPKEVPKWVNLPRLNVELPKGLKHSEGFYSEHAAKLIASSPDFKVFKPVEQRETDLPQEFPSREIFRKSGLNLSDVVELMNSGKLLEVDGIGEKTAEKVIEYLKNLTSEVNNNG